MDFQANDNCLANFNTIFSHNFSNTNTLDLTYMSFVILKCIITTKDTAYILLYSSHDIYNIVYIVYMYVLRSIYQQSYTNLPEQSSDNENSVCTQYKIHIYIRAKSVYIYKKHLFITRFTLCVFLCGIFTQKKKHLIHIYSICNDQIAHRR